MRGLSGLPKPSPPPSPKPAPIPVVDEIDDSAFLEDEEDFDDMIELTPEQIAALEAEDLEDFGDFDDDFEEFEDDGLEYEDDDPGEELTPEQLEALRESFGGDGGLDFDRMFGDLMPPDGK